LESLRDPTNQKSRWTRIEGGSKSDWRDPLHGVWVVGGGRSVLEEKPGGFGFLTTGGGGPVSRDRLWDWWSGEAFAAAGVVYLKCSL